MSFKRGFLMALVLSFLSVASAWRLHEDSQVVRLTDETFEHQTQASTGQTTGSWLVWFHTLDDKTSFGEEDSMPDPTVWSDDHIVLAAVEVNDSGSETTKRLQAQAASFIYIHRGKMYRYSKPAGGYSWDAIVEFCKNPDPSMAEDVPEPFSMWSHLVAKIKADKSLMLLFGGVIMVVVMGVWVAAVYGQYGATKTKLT